MNVNRLFVMLLFQGVFIYAFPQVGTMTDPRDSKVYKTKEIARRTWMTQNLDYAEQVNHSVLPREEHIIVCYNDSTVNPLKDGLLYSWEAAKKACPSGWRLPTRDEALGLVNDLSLMEVKGKNPLIDQSGFDATFGGGGDHFFVYVHFFRKDNMGVYWTSTEGYGKDAIALMINKKSPSRPRVRPWTTSYAFSVRCVKD